MDKTEPDFFDWDDLRQRVVALEDQLDDRRGEGVTSEIEKIKDDVADLSFEARELRYNLIKNFDELNRVLSEHNVIYPTRLPSFRWDRGIKK